MDGADLATIVIGGVEIGLIETTGFDPAPFAALLDDEERAYAASFVFEKDRLLCKAARVLSRRLLSKMTGIDPRALRFIRAELGRPELANDRTLSFNISHADGLVVCAASRKLLVGIDCEDTSRKTNVLEVAESVFAPPELADVRRTPTKFWRYWTLKEAYIKARGKGMSMPLQEFWFDLDAPNGPAINFSSEIDDDPSCWRFDELQPTARHRVALASFRAREPGR